MHKCTEKITTSEEFIEGTHEVHKRTKNITINEEVDKGTKSLDDMKQTVLTIRKKDSDKFKGQSKGST